MPAFMQRSSQDETECASHPTRSAAWRRQAGSSVQVVVKVRVPLEEVARVPVLSSKFSFDFPLVISQRPFHVSQLPLELQSLPGHLAGLPLYFRRDLF